jgi:thimet oligopeptidase
MEHKQVVTFFHEFGHLVHQMLARGSTWSTLAGINVEWDFVEAPSQLLEEWAYEPSVLGRFALHYESNEPIPAELVKKLKSAEEFGKGMHLMRQIFYTAFSFYLHNRNPEKIDLEAFSNEIYRDYSPYPAVKGGHIYANFGHLMGYSSMYYTYQWSLVIAKDLFTRFSTEGILNPDVAKAYRDAILVPGGSKDANQLVEDFLGRPYSLDAYGAWLKE